MKQGIIERHRTRRKIRKANRIARVDDHRSRRKIITVVLIVSLVAFVTIEIFSLIDAKRTHDRNLVRGLANDLVIDLSVINASFASNNHALLRDAHQQYRITLAELNRNGYMKRYQQNILNDLNEYDEILQGEEENTRLIKLRTAIMMLQEELQNTATEKVSTKSVIELKEHFLDFRDILEGLDGERFAEIKTQLINYSDELVTVIDRISVCVGTCTESTFKTRSTELQDIFKKYDEKLMELDAAVSDYYSPAELVESLKVLQ